MGIGVFEHHSLTGQEIQIGREAVGIAEEAHAVGAGGVHGDEDYVGGFRPDTHVRAEKKQEKKK